MYSITKVTIVSSITSALTVMAIHAVMPGVADFDFVIDRNESFVKSQAQLKTEQELLQEGLRVDAAEALRGLYGGCAANVEHKTQLSKDLCTDIFIEPAPHIHEQARSELSKIMMEARK